MLFQVNAQHGYYFPRHKTQEKVALLDYRNNISVFYDGLTGDAFGFFYERGLGIYIPSGVTDKTWNVKRQSYEEYFKDPFPPQEILSIGERKGIQFDPQLISDDTAEKLSEILTPLSTDYSSECEAFATALHVSKITSDRHKTYLADFEGVMGNVLTEIQGDFKWLVGMHQGLAEYFTPFGGIDALNKKKIHLDLAVILNKKGGIYVLCYLLEILAPKFDLKKVSGEQMNGEPQFFILINKLGGEIDHGYDGLIYILTEITLYNYGENSKENLRILLVRYCTNPRGNSDGLEEKWLSSIQFLRKTIKELKLEDPFNDLVKRLDDIIAGKWCQKGVNMSAVVKEIVQLQLPGKAKYADKILDKIEDKQ